MKDKKTKSMTFTFSILILLILSSFASIGTSYELIEDSNQKTNVRLWIDNFRTTFSTVNIKSEVIQPSGTSSLSGYENIVVADNEKDESYPSMVVSGFDAFVTYEFEHNSKPYLYFRKSDDYGQNWSESYKLEVKLDGAEISVNSPALCIHPSNKHAYGVFTSSIKNSGIIGILNKPDISGNLNNIDYEIIDWSDDGFFNFLKSDIVYSGLTNAPWITCSIGSTTFEGGPCNNSLIWCYINDNTPSQRWISWNPTIEDLSNVSIVMDEDFDIIYGVCEKNNGTNQDLLFFTGFYDYDEQDQPFINIIQYTNFTGYDSFSHPQIFVRNGRTYIVVESDTQGIILMYKSNSGNLWKTEVVDVTTTSSPRNPLIFVNETRIFCTFIEEGNILLTTSAINVIDWDEPIQFNNQNNTVVDEYRFADFADENIVVWTDTRNGNNDLYSVIQNLPEIDLMVIPGSVSIETEGYDFIPTKNRIKFTIRNMGEAPVEKVRVKISYFAKGQLRETDHPGTIAYLEGGEEETLNRPLFRFTALEFFSALYNFAGIVYINVTVDPEGKYSDSNINDNTVSIPVDYEDIFPVLKGLEQIFL